MERLNLNPTKRTPATAHSNLPPGSSTPSFAPGRGLQSTSFWTNLKDFLTERSVRVPRNARQEVFYTEGVDSSFSESLKAFFRRAPQINGAAMSGLVVDLDSMYRVVWCSLSHSIVPRYLTPSS